MRRKLNIASLAGLCLCLTLVPACSSEAENANTNANANNAVSANASNAGLATSNSSANTNTNKSSASEVPASLDVEKASVEELLPYIPDGGYRGTAEGFKDYITVRVVVKDHAINNISVLEEHETEGMFETAEPILSAMRDANSTDVDVISGATTTCEALKEAVTDALRGALA